MRKNSAAVWDQVWADPSISEADELIVATEAATIRWKRLEKVLLELFPTIKDKKVLEIGGGTGTYAALLAKQGARASVLDYSPVALKRAKTFFQAIKHPVTLIEADALNLPKNLLGKFDLSISVGLTEHFAGKQRIQIHQSHLDVLKKGGVAIFIVPNAYNPPYRIFKWISELLGTWKFGEEYPFTRAELKQIVAQIHGEFITLFGDDLYSSLKFVLPANFLRRWFRVGSPRNLQEIRSQHGSPFDNYLSYSFVLVVRKNSSF